MNVAVTIGSPAHHRLPPYATWIIAILLSGICVALIAEDLPAMASSDRDIPSMEEGPTEITGHPANHLRLTSPLKPPKTRAQVPMRDLRNNGGKLACAECGIIESICITQGHSDKIKQCRQAALGEMNTGTAAAKGKKSNPIYAITVRTNDGASHVIHDVHPARWSPRQRVIIIAGSPPGD